MLYYLWYKQHNIKEILRNPITGDVLEFIQTTEQSNGEKLEFLLKLAPGSSWAKWPRHFHPFQIETFKIERGKLNFIKGKNHSILTVLDAKVVVNPFELHAFWNQSNETTIIHAEIFNPRRIEKGLRLTYKLAQEGKVNKRCIPHNPLYTLVLMDYVDSYFRLIPWKIQRSFFSIGAKLARKFGLKYDCF